ncbi:amino acid permease [Streptomyces sp. NPDC003863]
MRLVWAMSRDERFPGWRAWRKVHASTGTPRNAAFFLLVVTEATLAVFANRTDALLTLSSAGALLSTIIYTAVVVLYLVRRRRLPAGHGFSLGRLKTPVAVVALIWLAFELSIFRDSSFADPWIYLCVMAAGGALYLGWLLWRRGLYGLAMPDMHSIDAGFRAGPDNHDGGTT